MVTGRHPRLSAANAAVLVILGVALLGLAHQTSEAVTTGAIAGSRTSSLAGFRGRRQNHRRGRLPHPIPGNLARLGPLRRLLPERNALVT